MSLPIPPELSTTPEAAATPAPSSGGAALHATHLPPVDLAARMHGLQAWLAPLAATHHLDPTTLAPASSDASFRRYFRIQGTGDHPSLIVMDAPPPQEDCRPFVAVAARFAAAGLNVPRVLAADLEQGYLLLGDLGNTTYLAALAATPDAAARSRLADRLYREACSALVQLQSASTATGLPPYDRALLTRELELFPEWYVGRHCGHTLSAGERSDLDRMFAALLENNLGQPQVDVHRDYHSRNLMVTATDNPGVLDFQDAVRGPITYDLVSLLRDAYVQWEEEQVLDWAIRYWEAARRAQLPVATDFGEFWRDFEWMGLQRHIKVLGIFARLYHRDGKDNYLADLPLVLHYTRSVAGRYGIFKPLLRLLDQLENRAPQVGYTF